MNDIITTSLTDENDEPVVLRAIRATYDTTGSPAIILWQCDPATGLLTSDDAWCTATVNGVWPCDDETVALDENNMGKRLTHDLITCDHVHDTGMRARSGWCQYPICTVDRAWYDGLVSLEDVEAEDGVRYFSPELVAEWE